MPSDNATEAATDVIIDSFPGGLTPAPPVPFDYFNQVATAIFVNQFTVTGGSITAADFFEVGGGAGDILRINHAGFSLLTFDNQSFQVNNDNGFAGLTFTNNAPSGVPEIDPASSMGSIALTMGLLGLLYDRRKAA